LTKLLSLRTLGGLVLRAGGQNITGAATQRRQLGLLAILAIGRDHGVPRERVLSLLWAETPERKARHILAQLLYAQRLELQVGTLFLGTKTLRLNVELIDTDVAEFEGALDAGDPARAVEAYRGPFLDGFHLGEAEEFERWQSAERARLAGRFAAALEELAHRADAAGELRGAVGWWGRLATHDPHNTRVAMGLVSALARAGDRAGALKQAALHEQILREEIGIEADPSFAELVSRLRT
jgi:DNA-binding SARP family transcriptional activator